MSFDGMPFSVDKVSIRDCQYGNHYCRKEKKEIENEKKVLREVKGASHSNALQYAGMYYHVAIYKLQDHKPHA